MLGPVSTLERWREESLMLDFVSGDALDERLTTTRASEASYFDADGVLRFANPNTPRIDYDPITRACRGLLVEEARTNVVTESSMLYRWSVTGARVEPHAAVAPDGTLTATKLIGAVNAVNPAIHQIERSMGQRDAGAVATASVFAKAAEAHELRLRAGRSDAESVLFNLLTGEGTAGYSVVSFSAVQCGNGWWRLSVTATTLQSNANQYLTLSIITSDNVSGAYVWGAQGELTGFPTSYIRTLPQFQSRASTAVYFDAQGVMRTAAVNEARYSHGYVDGRWVPTGLIVEAAATNLVRDSNRTTSQYGWIGVPGTTVTGTVDAASAPDGTQTATVVNAISAGWSLYTICQVQSGSTMTYSYYYKIGTAAKVMHAVYAEQVNQFIVSATDSRGVDVGNGWRRQHVTFVVPAGCTSVRVYPCRDVAGTVSVWGNMLESGNTPTSVILTSGAPETRAGDVAPSAAVTRAADVLNMPTAGWYRQDEGTFITETERAFLPVSGANHIIFDVGAGGVFGTSVYTTETSGGLSASPSVAPMQLSINRSTTDRIKRVALALKVNDAALSVNNNTAVGTDTDNGVPVNPTRLTIGSASWGGGAFGSFYGGHIKRLAYIPRRLSNADLQRVSTR